MLVANDSTRNLAPRTYLRIGLALVLAAVSGGCAGYRSLRDQGSVMVSRFWGPPSKSINSQGYDLYAESISAAHKQPSAATVADREDAAPRRDTPAAAALASTGRERPSSRPSSPGPSLSGRRRARTEDTTIRVTLGRPESLPALNSPANADANAGAPLMASAASTTWRRPPEAPDRSRSRSSGEPAASNGSTSPEERPRRASSRAAAEPNQEPSTSSPTPESRLRGILTAARRHVVGLETYQVSITRVERVGGRLQPEEEVLLSIRRTPKAVRLEWPSGPSQGREVIYSSAANDRMMYVNMANSPLPISRMTIPIDSPLVMRNSRHAITEAGFDTIFQNLFRHIDANPAEVQAAGKLEYKGLDQPKGLEKACHLIERVTPQGEIWRVHLDPKSLMPVLVVAYDSQGELIERYAYRNLRENPTQLASVDAFDPDKRWGESKSWLSRLAGATGPATGTGSGQPTRR